MGQTDASPSLVKRSRPCGSGTLNPGLEETETVLQAEDHQEHRYGGKTRPKVQGMDSRVAGEQEVPVEAGLQPLRRRPPVCAESLTNPTSQGALMRFPKGRVKVSSGF